MAEIINFQVERAVRKSGIQDRALIKDIINDGFDPFNKKEVEQYWDWFSIQSGPIDIDTDWTSDALTNLLYDIVNEVDTE
jgi:hypothetical protein|tara:strand:+ start:9767 stop:10006 length:240 start_codon:yes stop_codon:yes gene_type:complete